MKKTYYYLELENISPIHIGNGENNYTDLDVLKDKSGNFYLPGTSIAGCILHSLNEEHKKMFCPEYLVNIDDNKVSQKKQSPFTINDARMIEQTSIVETRDGIALDKNKITKDGAKFDYEIIPTGHHFELCIEITNYENDNNNYDELMNQILSLIQNQDIKIGYKTTRGLGRLKIIKAGFKIFETISFQNKKEIIKEYINFDRYNFKNYSSLDINNIKSKKFTTIEVQLEQRGGISIRTYNTSKDNVDYEHIRSNNNPIIPGSSWNGLIRKNIEKYINDFKLDINIEDLFGSIHKDKMTNDNKIKSHIYISESIIADGFDKVQTRIRINPFFSGTGKNRALYKEKSHYDGHTSLVISIDKNVKNLNTVISLMMLVLKDLDQGFIALGGETSIGRGLFKVIEIKVNGDIKTFNDYMEEYVC